MELLSTAAIATISGLLTGLSLIVAIGAQNTFVLQQGLRRQHVAAVVAVCTGSDLVLITLGVLGVGSVVEHHPGLVDVIRWIGAAVLVGYAGLALRRAVRGADLTTEPVGVRSRRGALLTCLALTWLNPHVYLDTVLLVGSLAVSQDGALAHGRWFFGVGAMVASTAWFIALGAGSRLLSRLLRTRRSWRLLDTVIAVIMISSAARLMLA